MQRPQIYFFLLPFTIISLILYVRILCVLCRRCKTYNTLFYKLIRTQAVFDISFVSFFFVHEIPTDWPALCPFLMHMHPLIVQLIYAHGYVSVTCQVIGVTLNSTGRMLMICHPLCAISKTVDELSTGKLIILHYSPPLVFGAWIMFGQEWSWYEYQDATDRVARTTVSHAVQFNSVVTMTTSISGAVISTFCYVLIFISLRQKKLSSYQELPILISSFILFISLCALACYYFFNGLFSVINLDAMYALRMHYYAVAFPISLLNPWCLILTSKSMRKAVLGKRLSVSPMMRFLMTTSVEGQGKPAAAAATKTPHATTLPRAHP